jgi:hypothetical protein
MAVLEKLNWSDRRGRWVAYVVSRLFGRLLQSNIRMRAEPKRAPASAYMTSDPQTRS